MIKDNFTGEAWYVGKFWDGSYGFCKVNVIKTSNIKCTLEKSSEVDGLRLVYREKVYDKECDARFNKAALNLRLAEEKVCSFNVKLKDAKRYYDECKDEFNKATKGY